MKKKRIIHIQDRKLGDEWIDWKGDLKETDKNSDTGKRIFLGVLLVTIVISGLISLLVWYMITPRLNQFHPLLPLIVGAVFLALWGVFSLWFLLMVVSILFEKDFFMRLGGKEISLTFLVPIALRLGTRIGISRDRIGNSFVRVSNTLIRTTAQRVTPEKLLILLPRCLQRSLIQRITDFSKRLKIPVYTVPGGEKAREIVYKLRPKAIIGVACERDLLNGIQEIMTKIPVIGVPNRRPEGPCKNTTVDLEEFEKAVQTFLGSEICLFAANELR